MTDWEKYEDDADRIAETLFQLDYKGQITNPDSFNKFYNEYLDKSPTLRGSATFRQMTFNKFRENYSDRFNKFSEKPDKSKPKIKRDYKHLGFIGRKVVYLRREYVHTPLGTRVIYRDRNGNVGKPKNKKVF